MAEDPAPMTSAVAALALGATSAAARAALANINLDILIFLEFPLSITFANSLLTV
jgi:hypothetical protein